MDPNTIPDLATFIGIVTVATWIVVEIVGLVQALKPYKSQLAILVAIAIGIGVKIFNLGFTEMHWYEFVISIAFSAGGSQVFNDKIARPLHLRLGKR